MSALHLSHSCKLRELCSFTFSQYEHFLLSSLTLCRVCRSSVVCFMFSSWSAFGRSSGSFLIVSHLLACVRQSDYASFLLLVTTGAVGWGSFSVLCPSSFAAHRDLSHLCAARRLLRAARPPAALCGGLRLRGSRSPPTPLLSIAPLSDWWFAVGALAPLKGSLHQRGLLPVRIGFSFARNCLSRCSRTVSTLIWGFSWRPRTRDNNNLISSTASLYRWYPTPLCGLRHGVIRWFVRHRWLVIDHRVSLSSDFSDWSLCFSCHCHTLLPFTYSDDSLSVLHAGVLTLFFECLLFSVFDLALCLVVSGHHSTQTCPQGSTGLHVWWSLGGLSLPRGSSRCGLDLLR